MSIIITALLMMATHDKFLMPGYWKSTATDVISLSIQIIRFRSNGESKAFLGDPQEDGGNHRQIWLPGLLWPVGVVLSSPKKVVNFDRLSQWQSLKREVPWEGPFDTEDGVWRRQLQGRCCSAFWRQDLE